MTTYKLKLIEWADAYNGDHDWTRLTEVPEDLQPIPVQTVGFEIRRNESTVTLAMSLHDDKCCDLFTIPLSQVLREKVLSTRFRS